MTGRGMRRPTVVEIGLAALVVLLLGALWGWRSDGRAPAPADLRALPARATAPEVALLTDEGIRRFAGREFAEACERFSEAAAQAAYKPAKPLDNTDMANGYRKKMSKVYVDRALQMLAAQ